MLHVPEAFSTARQPGLGFLQMICVYRASHGVEGNLVKGLLESYGLPARLDGEGLAGAYSGVPLASEVRIMVAEEHEKAARKVISDYENGADTAGGVGAMSWACPGCGESNGASFDHCWQCETDRPSTRNV